MSAAPTSPEMNLLVSLLLGVLPGGGEMSDAGILFNSSSSSEDKLSAGVSLVLSGVTAGISPNFGTFAKCTNELTEVTKKFGLFKCEECANAIVEVLKKHGVGGTYIEIMTKNADRYPYIWHDGIGKNISTNGRHVAVEVDGMVYDNLHKNGIPRAEWEQQFQAIHGGFDTFVVIETPIK